MKNVFFLLMTLFISMAASAAKIGFPSNAPMSYEAECASCHMAYVPGLLGSKNWQSIMGSLDKHFGTDASLDTKANTEITQWLVNNAASRPKYSALAPDNRISNNVWFVREHHEIKAEVWKRASVKSASNCAACHTDAAKGIFNEDNIRIPAK
jgi:hypothetical protein